MNCYSQGGALGSLLTTLVFYPLDVAKTRFQARVGDSETPTQRKELAEKPRSRQLIRRRTSYGDELKFLVQSPDLCYAGLGTPKLSVQVRDWTCHNRFGFVGLKLQLAIVSSFVYFYVYATLKVWSLLGSIYCYAS